MANTNDAENSIGTGNESQSEMYVSQQAGMSGGSSDPVSVSVELHLPVPPPDAQSIDHLSAEAVATTIGAWKEMTLTNLPEHLNGLDLSTVLPGAKLTITKITSKSGQFAVQAMIQRPGGGEKPGCPHQIHRRREFHQQCL